MFHNDYSIIEQFLETARTPHRPSRTASSHQDSLTVDATHHLCIFVKVTAAARDQGKTNMTAPDHMPDWFRLDNAAKIFPAVDNRRDTTMFRLTAALDEPVDPERLQRAVDNLIERFPYFQVKLRAGLFWHYLQTIPGRVLVKRERETPCATINARSGKTYLYRVLYFDRRIVLEFSHILTDGAGGLEYCRALIAEYLKLGGVKLYDLEDIKRPGHEIPPEEYEDSYQQFADNTIPDPPELERAFQIPDSLVYPWRLAVTTGISPIKPLLDLSRNSKVSLTEYLSAVYIEALYEYLMNIPRTERRRFLRPIRLVIPVNARKIFSVNTMRNFILHVTPGIDPRLGSYSFDEILNQVHHFMRVELNEKFIKQQIARNMRGETIPFIRFTPLFVKIPIEKVFYQKYGNGIVSGVLSNLGPVAVPESIAQRVRRFEFITVPNQDTKLSAGIISYGDRIFMTFGSLIDDRSIEKRFFTSIRKRGIPVKIETNYTQKRYRQKEGCPSSEAVR